MDVLVTGAYGRCGTAIIDQLHSNSSYDFTYLNRTDREGDHEYAGYETIVADISNYQPIRAAMEGHDAVIHLAAYPEVESTFEDVMEPNILGTYNVLKAARETEVESVIFGSTNHVVGMYEEELAPEIYMPDSEIVIDHTAAVRPDSFYGASKSFGEDLGRYFVENYEYPQRFYSLRICSVRSPEYDHPYGDAEKGVNDGIWDRDSMEYQHEVARMKAMWHSRRDFAHEIDCCLKDDTVEFDIFYGVSNNTRRWFDIGHARSTISYDPQDDGEVWESPPE